MRSRGFTLVEVLVAFVVLSLILLVLLQVAQSTFALTQDSNRRMDATQNARAALDSLETDLSHLVAEYGLGLCIAQVHSTNSPQFAFLTRGRTSAGSDGRLLAVFYELSAGDFQRRAAPVLWTNASLIDATFGAVPPAGTLSSVATGIVRMEAVVTLEDGTIHPLAGPGVLTNTLAGRTLGNGFLAVGPRVRSLTVAVATVDAQSLQLPNVTRLGGDLPAAAGGRTPLDAWNEAVTGGALDGYPASVRSSLCLLQKTYLLP